MEATEEENVDGSAASSGSGINLTGPDERGAGVTVSDGRESVATASTSSAEACCEEERNKERKCKNSTAAGDCDLSLVTAAATPAAAGTTPAAAETTPAAISKCDKSCDTDGEEAVKFKRLKLSHRNYRTTTNSSTENAANGDEEAVDSSGKHVAPGSGSCSGATGSEASAGASRSPDAAVASNSSSSPDAAVTSSSSSSYSTAVGQGSSNEADRADKETPKPDTGSTSSSSSSSSSDPEDRRRSRVRARRIVRAEEIETSSDSDQMAEDSQGSDIPEVSDSDSTDAGDQQEASVAALVQDLLQKPLPTPRYSLAHDLHSMQLGSRLFPSYGNRFICSVDVVKRFQLSAKLAGHEGCVNSLNFNSSGSKIASGSDDLNIIVWDWERRKKLLVFNTGHRENVFQSKFLPGDLLVTSCSRDGQVRLAELSTTGSLRSTKKLAQHRGAVHKMSLIPDSRFNVLSAGEDGQVISIDIREQKPEKILLLKNDREKKVPIYSIHNNPGNIYQFCTAGRDEYIRIFDRRYISETEGAVTKFCPALLRDSKTFKAYITSAVFNYNGTEVIGSYNDEDVYLFNSGDPETADFTKHFKGHRNHATVKGVNFFGPRSEYVISGSDCGNIFFWSKETEAIVNIVPGDDNGVVNVLESHPSLPVLATSGLDDEVKVWLPTMAREGPGTSVIARDKTTYIRKTVRKNLADKESQRNTESDPLDGQMLWELWRHIRRTDRRRRETIAARGGTEEVSEDSEDQEGEDEDSDDGEGPRINCAQS